MSTFFNSNGDWLGKVIARLREYGVDFFINGLLEPMSSIKDDSFQQYWPVNSERFKDLVRVTFGELHNGRPPKTAELDQLMALIREECRSGGRRCTEVEAVQFEDQVIVQGIICYLNDEEIFNDRTAKLLNKLHLIQAAGRITNIELLTPLVNVFSRRLKRLVPILRGFHIEAAITHREDGSYCTLRRLENFQREPSGAFGISPTNDDIDASSSWRPSVGTPRLERALGRTDATDGNFRVEQSPSPEDQSDSPHNER